MVFVKTILIIFVLLAVLLFGIHLVKNNHVVATNLLQNASVFTTKEVVKPEAQRLERNKYIRARVMLYIIGTSFILGAVIGVAIHVKRLF